jgi:hypothetical protein
MAPLLCRQILFGVMISGRRQQRGFRGRMQNVVCQLMGFGLVQQYAMKANGVILQHGVKHGSAIISSMFIISITLIEMK